MIKKRAGVCWLCCEEEGAGGCARAKKESASCAEEKRGQCCEELPLEVHREKV